MQLPLRHVMMGAVDADNWYRPWHLSSAQELKRRHPSVDVLAIPLWGMMHAYLAPVCDRFAGCFAKTRPHNSRFADV
jgi:hypothetical protein